MCEVYMVGELLDHWQLCEGSVHQMVIQIAHDYSILAVVSGHDV